MSFKIQIDDEVRAASVEEIAEIEAREAEALANEKAKADKAAAKAALLERLGITEEEAQLLLG